MSLSVGRYTVRPTDTPISVATKLYSDPRRATDLVQANGGGDWEPGTVIDVPGRSGQIVEAQEGDAFTRIFARLGMTGATSQVKDAFFAWNGGYDRKIKAGDELFILQARTNTGY